MPGKPFSAAEKKKLKKKGGKPKKGSMPPAGKGKAPTKGPGGFGY